MSQTYEPARDASPRRAAARRHRAGPPADAARALPVQAVDTGAIRPVHPADLPDELLTDLLSTADGAPEPVLDDEPAPVPHAVDHEPLAVMSLVGARSVAAPMTTAVPGPPAAPRGPVAQAGQQPPDRDRQRDERAARRSRSGAGPASGRLTGSKITGPSGGRGNDRGRPADSRRYPPQPQDPAPADGALLPADPVADPTSGSVPWLVEAEEPTGFSAAFGRRTADGSPMPLPDDLPGAEGAGAPSLVRPYSRTGGRTKPGHELDLEALVVTTVNGREAWSSPLLSPEHVQVIALCVDTISVAEIAARLTVPIGVARVIIADMVDLGLVEVMKTSANFGDERDPAFLRRVLSGLQRL